MDMWHHVMRRESFYEDNEDDLMHASWLLFSGVHSRTQKYYKRALYFVRRKKTLRKEKNI